MQVYALTNEEVAFCQLVATGRTQAEAYSFAFFASAITNKETANVSAGRIIKARPGIPALIKALQHTANAEDRNPKEDRRKKAKPVSISTKDAQLKELEALYNQAQEPKQRAEILKQVADLQQLKHEQSAEKEKRVHYYLPLRCEECPYKPKK